MNFGVHGRKFSSSRIEIIKQFFRELEKRKSQVFVSSQFHKVLDKAKISTKSAQVYNPGEDLSDLDFVISLGGDGTLLETITHVAIRKFH